MIGKLTAWYATLPANIKKWGTIGTCAAVVLGLSASLAGESKRFTRNNARQVAAKEVFANNGDMEKYGIQGLAAKQDEDRREIQKLTQTIKGLQEEIRRNKGQGPNGEGSPEDIEKRIRASVIDEFEKKYGPQIEAAKAAATQARNQTQSMSPVHEPGPAPGDFLNEVSPSTLQGVDWGSGGRVAVPAEGRGRDAAVGAVKMRTIAAADETKDDKGGVGRKGKEKDKKDDGVWLPSGSIFSGTLIVGMDAPTADSVKKDPMPVLMRIKQEAILPNRYRSDVRECFMVASGYGDLSTERAYIRAERISCVREDGGVLESPIKMYAVGEDGKTGVRGRLVQRAGGVLAKAMLAGFGQAASKMFSFSPVPTLQTTATTVTPYQKTFSDKAMQSATLSGTGEALQQIAEYYLKLADQMHPIIEIDAGRAIDFVMTTGMKLKLQENGR